MLKSNTSLRGARRRRGNPYKRRRQPSIKRLLRYARNDCKVASTRNDGLNRYRSQ